MIGRIVGQYSVLQQLGSGGMGAVYKALDARLGRMVALKFLPRELNENEGARLRFLQEAQAASALDHPNICTIYQIEETDDGVLYIVMAYYQGETLAERLRQSPLLVDVAAGIAAQIAAGLHAAHQHGVVHRDVKPANIFLTDDGMAKILDFGIAKLRGGLPITREHSVFGTATYMSPEQATGSPVDHRSDVWSLGVVL